MKNIFLLLSVCISVTVTAQNWTKSFMINGYVEGFPDSTIVRLGEMAGMSMPPFDSTWIVNNQFSFRGNLSAPTIRVIITIQDNPDYKYFWVDSHPVTFKGIKGNFHEATIVGSTMQTDQESITDQASAMAYIEKHPHSIVSVSQLDVFALSWSKDTVSRLYNGLSKQMQQTAYGKNVRDCIDFLHHPKIGDRYIDFSQQDTSGQEISLSDYSGQIMFLDFWGSWCIPCIKQLPSLIKVYDEFKDKGVTFVGIAADVTREGWTKAIRTASIPWINVSDLKGNRNKACLAYGVSYFPTNFLIDDKGKIIAKDLAPEALREMLVRLVSTIKF